jgi:hypothetical protein
MRAAFSLLFLAAMLGVGCGDQGPSPVAGTYLLQTVDGERSPFTGWVTSDTRTVNGQYIFVEVLEEYVSDTLSLNADHTFERTGVFRATERAYGSFTGELVDSTITWYSVTWTGTWAVVERTVEITHSAGSVWSGTLDGDVLTLVAESGEHMVYRRRD